MLSLYYFRIFFFALYYNFLNRYYLIMTLKSRNRLNFTLLIFSIAVLVTITAIVLIQILRGSVSFEEFDLFKTEGKPFMLQYSPISVIAAIFTELLFAVLSFYILLRAFSKTQAQNLLFFYLFLTGVILDCVRIVIPVFDVAKTYSSLLIACGNTSIFANLIIPLSLLGTTISADEDQKINLEQLLFSAILLSLFFASIIPLNTSRLLPNFCVDFGFKKTIFSLNMICYIASITILIISNAKKKYKQLTSIGFSLMIIGLTILRGTSTYAGLVVGFIFASFGQIMYLRELHHQYLWND